MKARLSKEELARQYTVQKRSVSEIALRMRCSEGKINYWLAKFSIPKRSISEAAYLKKNPDGDPFSFTPPQTIGAAFAYSVGLGLYWGEGNKKNKNTIRLGNTDPGLVRCFVEFLERTYRIPKHKFHFGIQIFSDMSVRETERFWAEYLGVSPKQFWKTVVTPARGVGTYREKTKHGVLTVYVSNKKLRDLMRAQIENLRSMPYPALVRSKPRYVGIPRPRSFA